MDEILTILERHTGHLYLPDEVIVPHLPDSLAFFQICNELGLSAEAIENLPDCPTPRDLLEAKRIS